MSAIVALVAAGLVFGSCGSATPSAADPETRNEPALVHETTADPPDHAVPPEIGPPTEPDNRDLGQPADSPQAREQPDLAPPGERLADLGPGVADAIERATASPDMAILDVVGIIDDGPTAAEIAASGDGRTRDSSGELMQLDEPAGLACGNVEIALTAIDEGRDQAARDHVRSAADRSAVSEIDGIEAWASALADSIDSTDGSGGIDITTLVGFLSVCIEGGYAL
ncbi:MAG: hypothetical protein ACR2QK_08585 [Acidimicrobiales bacterium]